MTGDSHKDYVGRFAPSPSGPLHFGSLVAALGSYLETKIHNGRWLLRVEDLDPPREIPGAADDILRTLSAFGFIWDGEVLYQSRRTSAYQAALDQLTLQNRAYPCQCSRKEVAAVSTHKGLEGPIYPGTCRSKAPSPEKPLAIRLVTDNQTVRFEDGAFGLQEQSIDREIGDFVIRRSDKLFAYQLAVVVDDAFQKITHVVRGADLLSSTPRQILLQEYLGLPTLHYLHLPLVMGSEGKKLSKQEGARPVDASNPLPALIEAYRFLGQRFTTLPTTLEQFWRDAISNWISSDIPTTQ